MFSSMFELGERQSEPCSQVGARLGGFFGRVKRLAIFANGKEEPFSNPIVIDINKHDHA